MRKITFENNEIYHIYNRGVEKRNIFTNVQDYSRFLNDLLIFNTGELRTYKETINSEVIETKPERPLVKIFSFCLMPNHFHLLLKQFSTNGTSRFLQKLCTAYTMYFNQSKERVGPLFQNRFKAKMISDDNHLLNIAHYIHFNPAEIMLGKRYNILNPQIITSKLLGYKWSSLIDFIGTKQFNNILDYEYLEEFFGKRDNYKASFHEWIKDMRLDSMSDVLIDEK